MGNRASRTRRRAPERQRRRLPLIVGGAVLLMAVAGLLLLRPTLTREGQQVALETRNERGVATAPVEVEEWSDFQ